MFGCIVTGRLVETNLQQVSPTKYTFVLPNAPNIKHVVTFMLGTIPFEPGFGASVHCLWPNKEWIFLGILTNDNPSAIYQVIPSREMAETLTESDNLTIGISVEPLSSLEPLMINKLQVQQNKAMEQTMKLLDNLQNFIYSFIDAKGNVQTNQGITWIPLTVFDNWRTKILEKIKRGEFS